MSLPSDEEAARAVADAVPVVLAYLDRELRYRFANRHYEERYGRERANVLGRTASEVLGAEAFAALEPSLREALRGRTAKTETTVMRDGRPPLHVTATYVPDLGPDGKVRGVAVLSEDITERRMADDRLRALHRVSTALVDARGTSDVGKLLARTLLDTLDATACSVFVVDEPSERLVRIGYAARAESSAVPIASVPLSAPLLSTRAVREKNPVWCPDNDDRERERLAAATKLPLDWFRSTCSVPLVADERVIGVVSFAFREVRSFETSEQQHGMAIASLAAQALARAQLFDREREGRLRAERATELHERLQAVVTSLSGARTSSEVVERVLDAGFHAMGGRNAGIWRLAGDCLRLLGSRGYDATLHAMFVEMRLDSGYPASEAVRKRTALFYESRAAYAEQHPEAEARSRVATRAEALAFTALPLLLDGAPLGVLAFAFDGERAFDDAERRFLRMLALQCAEALRRADLFEAERRARDRVGRMQEVVAAFSRARTAEEVAAAACRIGAEATEAYAGVLWLARASGDLEIAGSWGTPHEFVNQRRIITPAERELPAVRVLETREPVWVETAEEYRALAPETFERARASGRVSAYGALPICRDDHEVIGVIVFAHPIGHRYDAAERGFYGALAQHCSHALDRARLLDESRAAAAEAERANRVKDEFLAMLGHELRNPLAPIVTALELMKARIGDGEHERSIIERQVRHLGRLVDDLLDVSRIAAGRVELDEQPFDLADAIERAVEMAAPLIEQRGHQLVVEAHRGMTVHGDATRIAQVLANLLTNAAKYTDAGGSIGVVAAAEGSVAVVRVKDDGAGIAPELLPRVFDLFTQGPQGPDRKSGGLGLGLAIAKSLVERHRGTIEAKSEGRGTEIVVRLPLADAPPVIVRPSQPPPAAPLGTRGKVLVVDDNDDARELVALALTTSGFATREAADGPAALQVIAEGFVPDVALLDIGLPTMDGYELAQRIRAIPSLGRIRLVALTGYGQASDRQRSTAAGFDEHLVKPVDLERLDATLAALVR